MTPINLQLIKKPAIYGMILLFSQLPLVYISLIAQKSNTNHFDSGRMSDLKGNNDPKGNEVNGMD